MTFHKEKVRKQFYSFTSLASTGSPQTRYSQCVVRELPLGGARDKKNNGDLECFQVEFLPVIKTSK